MSKFWLKISSLVESSRCLENHGKIKKTLLVGHHSLKTSLAICYGGKGEGDKRRPDMDSEFF